MSLSIIVATNKNGLIGINNTLPWHLPDDLQYFKTMTLGCPIIMGRKTYQSIGRALPKRANFILTRDTTFQASGCIIVHDLSHAIDLAKKENKETFVIGGAELYKQALPLCDTIYLTVIDNEDNGDIYFPESLASLTQQDWRVTQEKAHPKDDQHAYKFTWYTLVKKPVTMTG